MTQDKPGSRRKDARAARKGEPGGTGRRRGRRPLDVNDDERAVLAAVGASARGLTIHGIALQLCNQFEDPAWKERVNRLGRDWTQDEIRGKVTRLVRGGYLKREGTEVLRWYEISSQGRGYLSVEEEK